MLTENGDSRSPFPILPTNAVRSLAIRRVTKKGAGRDSAVTTVSQFLGIFLPPLYVLLLSTVDVPVEFAVSGLLSALLKIKVTHIVPPWLASL